MGSEVRFYHLTQSRFEQALPQVLQKALSRDMQVIIQTGEDKERVEYLNHFLWTFSDRVFLPHGSSQDGNGEHHPIWITHDNDNPNQADLMILCDGAEIENLETFDLCCYFFDGNNKDAVTKARTYWKNLSETDLDLTYWQQGDQGGWQKKNA